MPTALMTETTNGFVNAVNNPSIDSVNGGWIVTSPGGDDWFHVEGQEFWCTDGRYNLPFRITNSLAYGVWRITWILDWEERQSGVDISNTLIDGVDATEFVDFTATNVATEWLPFEESETVSEQPIYAAEYTDFTFGRPFLWHNRWYVVFEQDDPRQFYAGQIWFCEWENCEYELLGTSVSPERFGSENSFRIEWIEPEPDYEEERYDAADVDDGYSEENSNADERDVVPVIATNIGRNVPYVSFEQEFSGNGEMVARRLYEAGFGSGRYVDGYHSADGRYERDNGSPRFCYVETDSSCGYELIFDRMQLNQRSQAEKISAVQVILKELKNDGHIRLSARCGFHVHVDVSDWGMKEIVSAYHLWNYLEDPIFRFASAFWDCHRDEEVGGGYSTPVPKGYTGRREIGRSLVTRRDALNFSPILNARGNCSCQAAFYEDWAGCTCNVRQPTLEFRVFNATTNQRKIRAYLAFCVAFVNIAKSAEFEPAAFPEFRWRGTHNKSPLDFEKTWEDASLERIKFILDEFPLTSAEKTDITYCLRNSSLKPVVELL